MADQVAGSSVDGAAGDSGAIPPGVQETQDSQTSEVRRPDQQSAGAVDEDPEWDFGEGRRFKRSEAIKKIKHLEKGFHHKAESAAVASKRLDALSQALSRYGITAEEFLADPDSHFDKAAQARIARQMDEAIMDPKERELTQRERDLATREEKQREFDKKQEQHEREQRTAQEVERITQAMAPALAASGLPANPKTVARMAEVMKAALRDGIRLDPAEAADYVREHLEQEQDWYIGQSNDAEALIHRITSGGKHPERLELIRKHLIDQAQNKRTPANPNPKPKAAPRDQATGKYLGWGSYMQAKNQRT